MKILYIDSNKKKNILSNYFSYMGHFISKVSVQINYSCLGHAFLTQHSQPKK